MKQHIILVHGLCHGAWCWYKLATLLQSEGHGLTIPDLSASEIDERKIKEVATFLEYSKPLLGILATLPPEEKVILVGHSLGGINIAMAADRFPEKVAALVFVTAFMPDTTHSPYHVMKNVEDPHYGWLDTQFSSVETIEGRPLTAVLFGHRFLASKLYQRCSLEDLKLARTLVRPGSVFAEDLGSTPPFSKDRYGSVPRFYIMCSNDAAIPIDDQRWMIQNYPVKRVFEMDDHMAMLSRPRELCQSLLCIADDVNGGD